MGEEQLGQQVAHFAAGVNALTESALSAALIAPDTETQQNIINATKAIALGAKQLVLSAKDVQKNKDDTLSARTLASATSSFPAAAATLTAVLKGEAAGPALPVGAGAAPAASSVASVEAARKAVLDIAAVKANAAATAQSVLESARGVSASATPLVFATTQEELHEGATDALHAVRSAALSPHGAAHRVAPGARSRREREGRVQGAPRARVWASDLCQGRHGVHGRAHRCRVQPRSLQPCCTLPLPLLSSRTLTPCAR